MAKREHHSDSTEDHVERIADLLDKKGYARVSDLAEQLNLSSSTVSNMIRRLSARGLVNFEKYRGFSLTPAGRAIADKIRARHQTLTEFFSLLGLEPEIVAEEVEDIEHHLGPKTLQALAKLVKYWNKHPDRFRSFSKFKDS